MTNKDDPRRESCTRQVFADFIDEYQQVVFLCCKTLGLNETEAEDVASETFLENQLLGESNRISFPSRCRNAMDRKGVTNGPSFTLPEKPSK